jgi:hypothetical protein
MNRVSHSQPFDEFAIAVTALRNYTNLHSGPEYPDRREWLTGIGAIRFMLNVWFNFNHFINPLILQAAWYKLRERQINRPKGRNSLIRN